MPDGSLAPDNAELVAEAARMQAGELFRPPRCEHMFVSGEATILHADLDSFYASVEQRDDPRLRGRPVIVGGGVVLAASYEAKAYGVRTAMGGGAGAAAVPARGRRAAAVRPTPRPARRCSRSSSDTTPLVEGLSIDEAFLDVGGLRADLGHAGRDRRAAARAGPRARSGCRSRSASRGRSSSPRWPAASPSRTACSSCRRTASSTSCTRCRSSGCGASARSPRAKLRDRGITTVGEVAGSASPRWCRCSGRASGRHLHALAHNRDPRPVQRRPPPAVDRLAARARARAPSSPRARRDARRARRPGRPPAARRRARRAARWCCGCASTTSRGPPGRTRCRGDRARPQRSS